MTMLYCEYLKVVWQIREICLTFVEFCQRSIKFHVTALTCPCF